MTLSTETRESMKSSFLQRHDKNPYSPLRNCEVCELHRMGCEKPFMQADIIRTPEPGQENGQRPARILFVGEAPGGNEDFQDKPFVGDSGDMLRGPLQKVLKFARHELAFTNAVVCRPPGNKLANYPKALNHCKGGLWQEIQEIDPDIVVLVGGKPMQAVLGLDKITAMRGRVIYSSDVPKYHPRGMGLDDTRERIYFPILHPSYVMRRKMDVNTRKTFNKDLQRLRDVADGNFARERPKPPVEILLDIDKVVAAVESLNAVPGWTYDWETTGLDPYRPGAKILTVAFCRMVKKEGPLRKGESPYAPEGPAFSFPIDHPESPFNEEEKKRLKDALRGALGNPATFKIAHNHKFEILWAVLHLGVEPAGQLKDTMLQHHCLNEAAAHKLKGLANEYTPYEDYDRDMQELLAKAGGDWEKVAMMGMCLYNGGDAFVTGVLDEVFHEMLVEEGQIIVLERQLYPAMRLLARMEIEGVQVDMQRACEILEVVSKTIDILDVQMRGRKQIREAEELLFRLYLGKPDATRKEAAFDDARRDFLSAVAAQEELVAQGLPEDIEAFKEEVSRIRDWAGKLLKRKDSTEEQKAEAQRIIAALVVRRKRLMAALRELKKSQSIVDKFERRREKTRLSYEVCGQRAKAKARFDFMKPAHTRALFFNILNAPIVARTEKGIPSVNKKALKAYERRYRIAALLTDYRKLVKRRSSYLIPITTKKILKPDGRIHPNVTLLARTGRLRAGKADRGDSDTTDDSFSFNIQNLPRPDWIFCNEHRWDFDNRIKLAKKCPHCIRLSIRDIFVSAFPCPLHATSKGNCKDCGRIVGNDMAQLEFMVFGILAGEKKVIECAQLQRKLEIMKGELTAKTGNKYTEAWVKELLAKDPSDPWTKELQRIVAVIERKSAYADIHRISAAAAFNITPPEVTPEDRQRIKSAVSFGVAYGRGAPALAEDMKWSVKRAQEFIDNFFAGYPAMYDYIFNTIARAERDGFVLSALGRKIRVPEIRSDDDREISHARNVVVNFGVQSVSSDFVLLAAIEIDQILRDRGMRSRVIVLVHDAIYIDCPRDEVEEVEKLAKRLMEEVPSRFDFMTAPLRAETHAAVSLDQ